MKENWFFVRGLVRESGHWQDFPKKFAAAFPEKKVHLLDLLGNGSHFRENSPISIPGFARQLREDFLRARSQPQEKNYVLALSLGAMVTLEWLQEFPDIQGAVLINTSLRGLCPIYERMQPHNYPTILRLLFNKDPLFREQEILRITSNLYPEKARIAEEWAALQRARPVSKINALRQIFAALRYQPPMTKPQTRLLLLSSEKDRLVNSHCSEKIAKLWDCELRRHPEAGHDLPLDDPQWLIEQIRNW